MTTTTDPKPLRGFQTLSPERRREIASMGGQTSQREGKAHRWSSDSAREAGKKGAAARAAKRSKPRPITAGVPAFDASKPCLLTTADPTRTYCERCKNPHHACDHAHGVWGYDEKHSEVA